MRKIVAKRLKQKAFDLCPYPNKENRVKTSIPTFEYTDESPRKIYQRLKKEYKKKVDKIKRMS